MLASSAVIDANFIVHWIVTTALMLVVYFGVRHALKED
jgi:hypothetical protein